MNIHYDQKDEQELWLKNRTAKAFYQFVVAPTLRQGAIALLQVRLHQTIRNYDFLFFFFVF